MSNSVRLEKGANSLELTRVVGYTVGELFDDTVVQDALDLTGDESVEICGSGSNDFESADTDDVANEGDTVRFSRSSGRKG